jgi:hypothetical protein
MKYQTPQVQAAGVASKLIQAKQQPGSDNGKPLGHIVALSTMLEAK